MAELTPDEIAELARAPKSVSADGQITVERDISDVIQAADDAAEQTAANKKKLPIRFMCSRPPGAN